MFTLLTFTLMVIVLIAPVAGIFWTEVTDARRAAQVKEKAKEELKQETQQAKTL